MATFKNVLVVAESGKSRILYYDPGKSVMKNVDQIKVNAKLIAKKENECPRSPSSCTKRETAEVDKSSQSRSSFTLYIWLARSQW